jgi:ferredoxin-NADP reductase
MRLFKVQEIKAIGKNTLLLTIAPKRKRDAITFSPGQYAAIGFKRNGRPSPMRCFSIVSSPRNPEVIQFAMRIQGDFTTAISELKQNDTVFLHGPFGDFAINERYDKNIIMLAGGIGITPFMSMARYAAETNSQIPMTLLYSCSYPEDIPFMDELLELEKCNPRFKVAYFITQGSVNKLQNIRRLAGRIDEDRLQQLTGGRYNKFTYFVCGPKQFTKSLSSTLLANNVAADRIITEEFTPSTSAASINTAPKYSITRWTYGLTGAALVLVVGFFMVLDLVRFVPKSLQAQASAAPSQATQSSPAISSNSSDTSSNYTSPTSTQPNNSSTSDTSSSLDGSSSNSSSSYSPAPTQTYQQPVTSVS